MPVSNFLIIKKGNYSSFQDKALSRGKKIIDPQKFKCCSLSSKSPVKTKRSAFLQ